MKGLKQESKKTCAVLNHSVPVEHLGFFPDRFEECGSILWGAQLVKLDVLIGWVSHPAVDFLFPASVRGYGPEHNRIFAEQHPQALPVPGIRPQLLL